jgi:hypothetical protein
MGYRTNNPSRDIRFKDAGLPRKVTRTLWYLSEVKRTVGSYSEVRVKLYLYHKAVLGYGTEFGRDDTSRAKDIRG